MATYPVVNTKTGEQKEVVMSVTEWDQWKSDNPDCLLYTSPSPRDLAVSRMPSSA